MAQEGETRPTPLAEDDFSLRPILIPAFAPAVLFGIAEGAVLPVVALTARDLGGSLAVASLVVALIGIGSLVSNIPSALITTRYGERVAIITAGGVAAAALLLAMLAPNNLCWDWRCCWWVPPTRCSSWLGRPTCPRWSRCTCERGHCPRSAARHGSASSSDRSSAPGRSNWPALGARTRSARSPRPLAGLVGVFATDLVLGADRRGTGSCLGHRADGAAFASAGVPHHRPRRDPGSGGARVPAGGAAAVGRASGPVAGGRVR